MKHKIARFSYLVSTIDFRYVRLAYFIVMVGVSIIMRSPTGGGSDPT